MPMQKNIILSEITKYSRQLTESIISQNGSGQLPISVIFNDNNLYDINNSLASLMIPYIPLNSNTPFFDANLQTIGITFNCLDCLGRTQQACCRLSPQTIWPQKRKNNIYQYYPSGWHSIKYKKGYIYHRCHLIGFHLYGPTTNTPLNLITGSSFFNLKGMYPFEKILAQSLKQFMHHIVYFVTPVYIKDDLIACGVILEAASIQVHNKALPFCVYVPNIMPEIHINYHTGDISY